MFVSVCPPEDAPEVESDEEEQYAKELEKERAKARPKKEGEKEKKEEEEEQKTKRKVCCVSCVFAQSTFRSQELCPFDSLLPCCSWRLWLSFSPLSLYQTTKRAREAEEAEEQKELAKIMMDKKKARLYSKIKVGTDRASVSFVCACVCIACECW